MAWLLRLLPREAGCGQRPLRATDVLVPTTEFPPEPRPSHPRSSGLVYEASTPQAASRWLPHRPSVLLDVNFAGSKRDALARRSSTACRNKGHSRGPLTARDDPRVALARGRWRQSFHSSSLSVPSARRDTRSCATREENRPGALLIEEGLIGPHQRGARSRSSTCVKASTRGLERFSSSSGL